MHFRRHNVLRVFKVLLTLSLLTSQLQAQNDSSRTKGFLTQGSWAIQFAVASNFALTSFKGTLLSVKYQLSEARAIRVGVSGEFSTSTSKVVDLESVNDRQNFQVTSSYLFYSNPREELFLFWGMGPNVSFDKTYEKYPSSSRPEYIVVRVLRHPTWGVGVAAVLGVEWFATEWLSTHAEYGGSVTYSWGNTLESTEYIATSTSASSYSVQFETSNKNWSFRPSYVMFGVSIYL